MFGCAFFGPGFYGTSYYGPECDISQEGKGPYPRFGGVQYDRINRDDQDILEIVTMLMNSDELI